MSIIKKSFWGWIKLFFIIIIFWASFFFWTEILSIGETTALILSAVLLIAIILKSNPNIINYIKKIKIGDFEVELNKEINEKGLNLVIPKKDAIDVRKKLDLNYLFKEFKKIRIAKREDIILEIDLKDGNYISLPMLYLYMWIYYYFGNLRALLFIATDKKSKKQLFGIISSDKAFQIFDENYPKYRNITKYFPGTLLEVDELEDMEFLYSSLMNVHGKDILGFSIFHRYFIEHLDRAIIEYPIAKNNYSLLLELIDSKSEYVIFVEKGNLKSIVPICSITKIIAKDYLNEILNRYK